VCIGFPLFLHVHLPIPPTVINTPLQPIHCRIASLGNLRLDFRLWWFPLTFKSVLLLAIWQNLIMPNLGYFILMKWWNDEMMKRPSRHLAVSFELLYFDERKLMNERFVCQLPKSSSWWIPNAIKSYVCLIWYGHFNLDFVNIIAFKFYTQQTWILLIDFWVNNVVKYYSARDLKFVSEWIR